MGGGRNFVFNIFVLLCKKAPLAAPLPVVMTMTPATTAATAAEGGGGYFLLLLVFCFVF